MLQNILYSFSSLFFQILFDQAQRSVRQQLHNFVKEWVLVLSVWSSASWTSIAPVLCALETELQPPHNYWRLCLEQKRHWRTEERIWFVWQLLLSPCYTIIWLPCVNQMSLSCSQLIVKARHEAYFQIRASSWSLVKFICRAHLCCFSLIL